MVLKACRFLLRFVGAYPLDDGLFPKLRLLVVFILFALTGTGLLVEAYSHFDDVNVLCRGFAGLPVLFLVTLCLILSIAKRSDLRKVLEMTDEFWTVDILNMRSRVGVNLPHKYANRFFVIYRCMCGVIFVQNYVLPIFFLNIKPSVLSYKESDPAYHTVICVFQLCTCIAFTPLIIGLDGIFLYLICSAVVEFKIIKLSFDTENLAGMKPIAFSESVRHHVFLICYIKELSKIYSSLLLALVSAEFIYLCFGLFLMTKDGIPPSGENVNNYLLPIVGFTLQMSLYCTLGQILTDTSYSLADVFFYKNWLSREQYENKTGKILVVKIAQKGQRISVGGYFSLNLELFALVLKNVASVTTFMQAMYD